MARILPLQGTTLDPTMGWMTIADAYSDLTLAYMAGDTRDAFASNSSENGESSGVDRVNAAMWSILGLVDRFAILEVSGRPALVEQGDDSDLPEAEQSNAPSWLRSEDPTSSDNALISLSHGTIGSGCATGERLKYLRFHWGERWGRHVLIDRASFNELAQQLGFKLAFYKDERSKNMREKQWAREAIEYLREHGTDGVTKEELRSHIALEASKTAWDRRVWPQIISEFPELSKGGRPPKKTYTPKKP